MTHNTPYHTITGIIVWQQEVGGVRKRGKIKVSLLAKRLMVTQVHMPGHSKQMCPQRERERERGREGAEERREGEWSGTIMTAFTTACLRVISPKGCAFKSMLEDAVITVQ